MFLFRQRRSNSAQGSGHLQAIRFSDEGRLELLDQRLLPLRTKYIEIKDVKAGWRAIHDMAVRGAPAIAISAALSLATDLIRSGSGSQFSSAAEASEAIKGKLDFLVTSRPTAVNLSIASAAIKDLVERAASSEGATPAGVVADVVAFAKRMLEDDVAQNKAIGEHGADALLKAAEDAGRKPGADGIRVLTICNTGSLATAGYGTALGVIRSLQARGKLKHVYACETRPYNQGSRLTAYEMVYEAMPATLICDSAAPSLMAKGDVDAIVVGADRITANGDTANKIGTSMLAVAAAHYGIPFFVAATLSTVDANTSDGSGIPIEERSPTELTHSMGRRVAAEGIKVWNPAFDVTKGSLIHGIITEAGCYEAKGNYDMAKFLNDSKSKPLRVIARKASATGESIKAVGTALTEDTVKTYILKRPELAKRVGPATSSSTWKIREVGDGNINFVYIVEGPDGALCIKQALPFVRCVGESWPLTQDRLKFEAQAMQIQAKLCPQHVPAIYEYNPAESVMVMQYLAPPHVILRHSMNQGVIYPRLAADCAEFLATTLFHTSFLAVPAEEFRRNVAASTNAAMCALTEQVIFEEPLFDASNNQYLKPQMQSEVEALWSDSAAKCAITQLKEKFISKPEALLHGDVHTGSMMVSQETTYFIDAEFACYGPIFFDVGKLISNLLLHFLSLDGRSSDSDNRAAQRAWVVKSIREFWTLFRQKFVALWDTKAHKGALFIDPLYGESNVSGAQAKRKFQDIFMEDLYNDCIRFAGASMIRRVVGIAGVDDLRGIKDAEARSVCEQRALRLARKLLTTKTSGIDAVIAAAELERQDGRTPYFCT